MESDAAVRTFGRNALINFLGAVWQFLLLLAGTRLVIDMLGAESYALLALVGGVTGYFVYLEIGIAETVVKKISEAATDEERSVTASTLFRLAVWLGTAIGSTTALFGLFGVDLLFAFDAHLMGELRSIFVIIGTGVFVFYPLNVFSKIFIGLHRFDIYNVLRVIYQTAILAGIIVAVKVWGSVAAAVAAITLCGIAWKAHSFFLLKRYYPAIRVEKGLYDSTRARGLLRYKSFSFLAQGSGVAMMQGGVYVAGIALTPSDVALFSVANVVALKTAEVAGVLCTALLPLLSTLYGADRMLQVRKAFSLGTLLIAVLLLPLSAFLYANAETILRLWINPEFIPGARTMQILCVAWYANVCTVVASVTVKGIDRPDIDAKWAAAVAILNVLLAFLLAGPLGIEGVAWASLIAQGGGALVLVYLAGRKIESDTFAIIVKLLLIFATGVVFTAVYYVPLPMYLFFLRPIVHSLLLFAGFYLFIAGEENRLYLKNIARMALERFFPKSAN